MSAPPGQQPVPSDADEREAKLREEARVMVLRIVVIVLGVILVAMAIVVFSTLIIRIVKGDGGTAAPPRAAAPAASASNAPSAPPAAGSAVAGRVVSTALGEGRLAVTVEADGRYTTILYDATSGRELARFPVGGAP